jgi:hypothetical protein
LGNKSKETAVPKDSLIRSFSVIEKDSAYFVNYQYAKGTDPKGELAFAYKSNTTGSFVILCDTMNRTFSVVDGKDTVLLHLLGDRIYTVNGKDYKVLKLLSNVGVTDGEVSYYVSTEFGLLFKKSNTWGIGRIWNPERSDHEFLESTALLYKVFTDEDFLSNRSNPPRSEIKFTTPKVE